MNRESARDGRRFGRPRVRHEGREIRDGQGTAANGPARPSELELGEHMQRFLAATLAAGICVAAGLVSATPAQAQTTHYGPGGGDGVEVWATPQAGGYQVEYNALNCTLDGDTRYPGFLQIVGTDGDKTYVQGEVVGGGATYTIRPASYFAPTQHYYDGVWATGERAELLNLNGDTPPANAPPTVSITAPSSGATYTAPSRRSSSTRARRSSARTPARPTRTPGRPSAPAATR